MTENKPSITFKSLNHLVLLFTLPQYILSPISAFLILNWFRGVIRGAVCLPLPTIFFLSIPFWAYFVCGYGILASLVIKEFFVSIEVRLLTNIIALVTIELFSVLFLLAIMMPLVAICTHLK